MVSVFLCFGVSVFSGVCCWSLVVGRWLLVVGCFVQNNVFAVFVVGCLAFGVWRLVCWCFGDLSVL